ncbi:hypothetical protein SDRG_07193 [Saprolegnia diclina VS20]|uniref:Uncharacterized protein n=1 Tax=Saprolegnia diclina (strain VS20) TaxID=1156394 RepID=T0QNU0_SAPDV|nr:hypothetical protein SDRG_07193 [Saprolegnia diclina VS20]EQC35485.1 hypothetical protein SDRG_07193 [Saprolegnia diclina VS20]|eukprot:XP_008611235.1 hypothetical protein SDRG_07193 [Saprolegnia diclina VS20]
MPTPTALKQQKLLAEKAMLERSLQLIESGTHEDFIARLSPLVQDKQRILAFGETRTAHLAASADVIFTYESEEAEKEYVAACAKLKHDMLEEIRLEMNRAVAQRAHGAGSHSYNKASMAYNRQASRRHTRSRKKPHAAFSLGDDWSNSRSKRPATVFTPLAKMLSSTEIGGDLRLLEEAADAFASATIAKARKGNDDDGNPIFARFEKGKMLYKDWILQEGDEIHITKPSSASYFAIICDLTSAEIFVLKESGKYSRVLVQDLRSGFVSVEPADADEAANLAGHDDDE